MANSVNPDEMAHTEPWFYLDLHCVPLCKGIKKIG